MTFVRVRALDVWLGSTLAPISINGLVWPLDARGSDKVPQRSRGHQGLKLIFCEDRHPELARLVEF
jgi:hypothetical protein